MNHLRKVLKSDRLRRFLCALIAIYVKLVYATSRWHHREDPHLTALYAKGKPFIIAHWHNRIFMMTKAWRLPDPITILTSDHRDGRLVSYVMGWFGFKTVYGSTNRADLTSLRRILRALKDGDYFGITPDGPRGPRMRVKPGVIAIARLSGCAIIPAAYATSRRRQLNSWDRFIVPLPFSKGVYLWGEPLSVPKDADAAQLEELRLELERRMTALTDEADRLTGHAPTPPAAPDEVRDKAKG